MDFRTKINIPSSSLKIKHHESILMLGSCFIENMGERLIKDKFDIDLNPFGILYNPVSISQALYVLLEGRRFTETDVFRYKGLYHSYYHHSNFSDVDRDVCLRKINDRITKSAHYLQQAKILFITFGTAYVYREKAQSLVVGNCHKLPASSFDRYRLSVTDIVKQWHDLIQKLRSFNPELEIIFTVSPIRHMKDGAHENQLSKSTLLLAINKLCEINVNLTYFPSYEIVLDELRDYRFYNEDMIHPNSVAIDYIWKRFGETYFEEDTTRTIADWSKIYAAISHRPFNRNSDEHKHFLKETLLKIKLFQTKYPYICLDKEIEELNALIQD